MTKTLVFYLLVAFLFVNIGLVSAEDKVYIGLDAAFGHQTSTSENAVKQGILIAIDEINSTGGVLGGRKLALVERDNRSVPARGIKNVRELAEVHDLVAVFCGKFTPVVQDEIPVIHELGLPLLDPWAAADNIIDNGHDPNYAFRLSLRDSWAVAAMIDFSQAKGKRSLGVLLPITGWGRSNDAAIQRYASGHPELKISGTEWYSWGETSMIARYNVLKKAGARAIILIANETEGSILVREVAALPEKERLPIISHWGVSGGNFTKLTGPAIEKVDFTVVQTYSFLGKDTEKVRKVLVAAQRLFNIRKAEEIKSPVGLAHAYDLTHILARAVNLAGTTDRKAVRDALEKVVNYDGLIKNYEKPFTKNRHEALSPDDVFMARFKKDGTIVPIKGK